RPHVVAREMGVDVVRAVDVARVAEILVVARGAGEAEGVVPAAGVLDDLDERLLVHRPVFREDAGPGIEGAVEGARRRRVDLALEPPVEGAQAEGLEVRTLASPVVEDLDVLPLPLLVGQDIAGLTLYTEKRVGERAGRADVGVGKAGSGAAAG